MFSLNGTLKKSGSVWQWEMNQFIGMSIQEMKADQKYSKVVGIRGGSCSINETEGAIKGGGGLYLSESSLSKKSSIEGVYILIAIDFFGVHRLIYF